MLCLYRIELETNGELYFTEYTQSQVSSSFLYVITFTS